MISRIVLFLVVLVCSGAVYADPDSISWNDLSKNEQRVLGPVANKYVTGATTAFTQRRQPMVRAF